ncbi:MAG: hypothetical protein RLZ09_651 [Pseudomonadota bacterium]
MNLFLTVRAIECLIATSLVIQTLEFLRLSRFADARSVWSWQLQRGDVAHTSVWLQKLFDWLFQERVHQAHLLLRLGAAASLFFGVSLVSAVFLFISSLLILIRWRGAFNGGSDFMTMVVLTGLLVSQVAQPIVGPVIAWKAGLWYVTIHSISSYFISGTIKLVSSDWRSGRVLIYFLDGGLYGPLSNDSLLRKKSIAVTASWSFIVWECLFPLALAGPQWAMLWCGIAGLFHFLVFRFFGLNRFFWAWAASFPAIIYCSTQW